MITFDFESRSACDLKKAGAWAYSMHPTTEIMCACWNFSEDPIDKVYEWQAGFPHLGIDQSPFPQELADRIAAGEILEAHNAFFEWAMYNHVFRKMLPDLPELPLSQIRCSAAKAAAFALPRALDKAIAALGLPQKKDMEGSANMLKLAKPRKPTAEEKKRFKAQGLDPEAAILFLEDREMILRNTKYCAQDVRAERGLSSVLRDLPPRELEFWQMDLRMNARGITCDMALVHIAIKLAEEDTDRQNAELKELTDGMVEKASGRVKFKQWMHDNGVKIPNTQGAVIDILLGHDPEDEEATAELRMELRGLAEALTPKTRRALEIVRDVNRSSVAKYKQMVIQVSEDNRLRDMMLYCGAARTGRWCVPGDYEVLTKQGWRRFDEWSGGEIAQWDNGQVTFESARVVSFEAPAIMRGLKSQTYLDVLATEEHTWPTYGYYKGAKLKKRSHQKLLDNSRANLKLPVSGEHKGRALTAYDRVRIMTQADGCFSQRAYHSSLIWEFKKERKIERCRALLVEAGIPFQEYQKASGAVSFVHNNPTEELRASKRLGPWLLDLDPAEALDEIMLWDGSKYPTHAVYSSVLKENADWVQALAHLCGRAAHVVLDSKREEGHNPIWRVSVRNKPHITLTDAEVQESPAPTPKVYCAETRTGYFLMRANGAVVVSGNSGKGVQPHNFIRGYSEIMQEVCNDILKADPERLRLLYNGSVLEVLSKATRGAMVAAYGKKLMVADFAAIEARVLLWLANAMTALDVFYRGEDIYLDMASAIFKYPCTNKDDFPFERKVGKAAILGLGYQMGWEKFEDECRNKNGITDQEPKFFKDVVRVYREERFPEVKSFWYDLNEAAIQAVRRYDPKTMSKGPRIQCRRLAWFMWGQFLHMELPSGRLLSYFRPLIKTRVTYMFPALNERGHECSVMVSGPADLAEAAARRKAQSLAKIAAKQLIPNGSPTVFKSDTLTFMHENSVTRQWERKETYGGELVENATQATARDLMAEAMLRVDSHPDYDLLLSVHDEEIAECDEDKGSVEEFEALMEELPDWAEGCPVDAEGWEGYRYRK